ncbi:MAG: hypothetical protein MJ214_02525 [Bacilli bacterium]|nr:hypothetical protein [Bacilli bacterium]
MYGRFSAISYGITWYLNGGTNDKDNPENFTIEDVITLKDAVRMGKTLLLGMKTRILPHLLPLLRIDINI